MDASVGKVNYEDGGAHFGHLEEAQPPDESDDVFLVRESFTKDTSLVPMRRNRNQRPVCSTDWSTTPQRARNQRGYNTPLKDLSVGALCTTRDSGYEASPTSPFSFSFPSDEEDSDSGLERGSTVATATSPIPIPSASFPNPKKAKQRFTSPSTLASGSSKAHPTPAPPRSRKTLKGPSASPFRKRSTSAPELGGSRMVLQRPAVVVKNTIRSPTSWEPPPHGRNYSLPATTSDGRPLLSPPAVPPSTPSSRASREGLIDLTEEDPEGSAGHRRRVLVLALPDIIVDSRCSDFLASSQDDESHPARYSSVPPSSSDSSEVEIDPLRPRPTWRRPRALSCDVTLEVEVGQDLRRIADDFCRETIHSGNAMWRQFRNSVVRRLSLGTPPGLDDAPSQSPPARDSRGTRSLPSSPSYPMEREDSDFGDYD